MSKEGSTEAPIRHPIDFEHPDFLNPEKLDSEMRRVFDICHGCRRCFNLCDSFPKLFDMIDESKNEDVESLSSDQFAPVVDACTLCDMCFMTKCPYVPPHEFDLDFPHLMLRYRTAQKKLGKLPAVPAQLAKIDRNAKFGVLFSKIINWASDVKNTFIRKILEIISGIDKRVQLPRYNSETFSNFFKKNKDKITYDTPSKDRKVVIYSTCFVNFNKKDTGVAALKVLKKNGVEVQEAYPGCCGMPFLEQADLPKVVEQAKKVSNDLINWIDKGYKVITLTASCGLMLKFEWPLLVPNDEKVKKLSQNVMDIDEYVVDIANKEGLAEGLQEIDGGVTVHHACHARAQNMGIKARDMLKYYGTNERTQVVTTNIADQNTFLKYLTSAQVTTDIPNHSKKFLYEEYTSRMKLNTGNEGYESKDVVSEHCEVCNIAREENSEEGILICPQCGSEEYMMVVSDFPSFRDPPKERNNYAYKKINHLNEILNQFQAKESTIIPDEVMNEVICEVKKRRIMNIAEMTEKDIREILKKINRSKYYEHATHILSRLNGNPPPTITPEIEEKIRAMFQEIQAPFLLYCPDDRTNFLSYSYILYKFFELLELDEYRIYFPLLKSRDRLIAHDFIWKKICDYLKWEYISSV